MKLGATGFMGMALGSATSGDAAGFFHSDDDDDDGSSSHSRNDRIHDFAHWAANFSLSDAPNDVVQNTEWQIGNAIATASKSQEYGDIDPPISGSEATVIGRGSGSVTDAVWCNATYGVRHDFTSYQFAGHSVFGTVFPGLAVAEAYGLDGEQLVENVLIGNEFSGRMGGSVLIGPNNGQMVASIHMAAAAIITARALGGGVEEIENAVRMALFNPNNPSPAGMMDGDGKSLTAAIPATAGIRIGRFAAEGGIGAADALENFHEFEAFLGIPELLDGWGDSWVSRSQCYKPNPGAAYVLPPLEAFNQVIDEEGIALDDIEEIRVDASILATATESLNQEHAPDDRLDPVGVNYSIANTLALRCVDGEVSAPNLEKDNLDAKEDQIRNWADRVEDTHDWDKTVETLEGFTGGIDFKPILKDRGLIEVAKAGAEMPQAYYSVDTTAEAASLVASKRALDLLSAIGQLGWDEFDMSKADFSKVDFSFPCEVEVVTESGWWSETSYSRSLPDHEGASSRSDANKRKVVREKFVSEFGDNFDVIDGLHNRDLEELTGLL